MKKETIKLIIFVVTVVILIVVGIIVINPSKYTKNKKYEKNMFASNNATISKGKEKLAQRRRHETHVRIINNTMANLGDFTFNSGGKTKIIANISLEFKNSKESFFSSNSAKEEIRTRGVILRSVVIDTMMDHHGLQTNSNKIKKELLHNINEKLSDALATHIYFNQFIVQH